METSQDKMERQENVSFNDILVALQDHLGVTQEELLRFFKVTLGCQKSGVWSFCLEPDKQATVSKDSGSSYKIGIQTIKKFEKSTQSMQPTDIPVLLERIHKKIRKVNVHTSDETRQGHQPDDFEPFSGDHPADE